MKAKLGITVGLLGAAVYFAALFGGYIPVLLIAGYALLMEDNEWIKKTVVKAVILMVSFGFLLTIINLIPSLLSWISSIVALFDGSFDYSVVNTIISIITKPIDIFRTCLFLILGVKSLKQGTIAIPFVDKLIEKYY